MHLYATLGGKWTEIGKKLGRLPSVVRIKWERINSSGQINKGNGGGGGAAATSCCCLLLYAANLRVA